MRKVPRLISDPAALFRHGGGFSSGLDFSVNLNPLGPPPSVHAALRCELNAVARYPDPACQTLSERFAAHHGVAAGQVVVGNGSNELIHTITQAFRPRHVAIAEPTYTEYLRAALMAGAAVEHWLPDGDDFQPCPFDPEAAELVWLCNPNNPTGQLWPRAAALADWMRRHPRTIFVVDEAFMPFCVEEGAHSLIPELATLGNVVVLRSMTKFYTLPGLRLGYAVAGVEHAQRLRDQLVPWSVNALAQLAGVAALADSEFRERTSAWLAGELRYMHSALGDFASQLRFLPSVANFILARLRTSAASALTADLHEQGLVIRDASNFVGLDAHYVRFAVRSRADNERLLEGLARVLEPEGRPWPARS